MLLEKFSEIIDRSAIGATVAEKQRLIEETNPNRIYVENIRSFFHIPYKAAKLLLELGVRTGALEKRIGFLCPSCERLIADAAPGESPEVLDCISCRVRGDLEEDIRADRCKQIEFYRLNRDTEQHG